VGRFAIAAKVDNDKVSVGEAVTLTVTVTGQGNLRRLTLPKLGPLEGWKVYDPKIAVSLEPGDVITGKKTFDYLLLPEKPGLTIIPAINLPFFDIEAKSYVTEKTSPVRLEVSGDGAAGATGAAGKLGAKAPSSMGAGVENVLPLEIRPLRSRTGFRRDLGTTFYRSRAFVAVLAIPPAALVLTVVAGFVRERLSQETDRARRRRLRRLVRRRLRTAERHLDGKNISSFFIEIDRVLRDFLTGKLGSSVAGLAHDELRATMVHAGLTEELVAKVIDELEECDRARFAPGDVSEQDMRSLLDRAAETILQIEKAALKPGVGS
jgi:hypothetical protein